MTICSTCRRAYNRMKQLPTCPHECRTCLREWYDGADALEENQQLRKLLEEIQDTEIIERHTELGVEMRAKVREALALARPAHQPTPATPATPAKLADLDLSIEPLDEKTGKCRYCKGRWDPVRDHREYIHEPTCPWVLAGKAT